MSSSLTSILNFVTKQVTIYIGIPIFIAGILGGVLNTITFLSLRTFRESSCAFYLTIMSFVNIGQLFSGLLSRIMINGFNIDWTLTSVFYCKFRPYSIYVTSLISSTCLCLAAVDQYFATCSRPRWQQWCTIKIAHRLVTTFSMVWILSQIPCLVFYNQIISPINNQTTCSITNVYFAQYQMYFNSLILWFILPLVTSTLCGILAYHNARHITYRTIPLVRRELDKQLTVMVLTQILFNFLMVVPNLITIFFTLSENFRKDPVFMIQVSFVYAMTSYLVYLNSASPLYIYISTSERFRRQLVYVVHQIFLNTIHQRLAIVNQIEPMT